MKIAFFACGFETPAARYRVKQFFPFFEKKGVTCSFFYAYGHSYNRIAPTALGAPYKLLARLKRGAQMMNVRGFDAVFLQRTAIPETAFPEVLASYLNPRIIFDFDDAIYLRKDGTEGRLRNSAVSTMARLSRAVIVGNNHLAARVGYVDKTEVIPTVIDTDRYTPGPSLCKDQVVIGWMGTASNFGQLRLILPAIQVVLKRNPHVVFRIISNQILRDVLGWESVEQWMWSADREILDLRSFDIGIMPLSDNEMTRGKCGFKLILYMATGKPVVASPVGSNLEIVEKGVTGHLSQTKEEWVDALEQLIQDHGFRTRAGEAGRYRAESLYSVQAVVPNYLQIFDRVAAM